MESQALFFPQSIAIIGASRTPKRVGNDIVKNLVTQGFTGKIFPINPQGETLYGHPVLPSIEALKEQIDLAIIAIPAKAVTAAIIAAHQKGAKAAIVISAGFKEIGNSDLEKELQVTCNQLGVTLIGPNCLGVINPSHHMNASFAGIMPEAGNVAFASQSGALCTSILDYARSYNLGFSKFLSIGNKACVDEATLLSLFANDPQTQVIAMYVEELHDAARFIRVCKEVTKGPNAKPIVVLKSGRTSAGAAAIASHTGSLSGGDAAYDALFSQAGVIRARTIRELFEFIVILSQNPIRPVNGVTIVTNAGGPGVLATDEVVANGLQLSKLDESTVSTLTTVLPQAANTHNPVDILGDADGERYANTLAVLAKDSGTDALMVLLTPQTMTEPTITAEAIIRAKELSHKPVVASFMGRETVDEAVHLLESAGVSTTSFPELAARGLRAMHQIATWSQLPSTPLPPQAVGTMAARQIIEQAKRSGASHLSEDQALRVFECYGIQTLKRRELLTHDDVTAAQDFFTSPVALKVISKDILHKSDVGGVMLSIHPKDIAQSVETLRKTVREHAPKARIEGVLAVEMAPSDGLEMIIGSSQNPGLGRSVLVGLGGVYVEVFKDVSMAFTPLCVEDCDRMIDDLACKKILEGVRGQSGYDSEAIRQVLARIAQLVETETSIREIDINPLLVLPKGRGALALDARIML